LAYVDRHLAPDERILFRTKLHPVVFANAVWWAIFVLGAVTMIVLHNDLRPESVRLFWLGGVAIALFGFVSPWVTWQTSEFAVTSRRVLLKQGFLRVHTVELLNAKVETVGVDQTLGGRLLGYGTLRVTGTGGTNEVFQRVARPEAFRDAVAQAPTSPVARAR